MNHRKLSVFALLILCLGALPLTALAPRAHATDYTLSLSVGGAGSANPAFELYWGSNGHMTTNGGDYVFGEGAEVKIYGYPAIWYLFSYFLIDGVNVTESPHNVTMNQNHVVEAHFYIPPEPSPTPTPSATPTPTPSVSPTPTPTPPPPFNGDWTGETTSPYWSYLSPTKQSFSGTNDTITYTTFTPNETTQGFIVNMNHVWGNLTMTPRGWLGDGQVDFVLLGEMTGSNGQKIYGMINFRDSAGYFGWDAACRVYFGNSQQWHHTIVKQAFANGSLPQYQVGMYFRQSGTTFTVSYYIHGYLTPNEGLNFGSGQNYDVSSWVWNETYTVPANFGDSTDLKIYVGWKGSGQGSFEETYILTQSVYDTMPPTGTYDTTTGADQSRSNLLSDIYNFLTGAFNFIIGIAQIIISILVQITPYLPFIALLYIIDLGITSFQKGSIQPVGAAFQQVFDIVVKVYDTVIHLGQLVWDAITFWS